jgi:hypothetical protein
MIEQGRDHERFSELLAELLDGKLTDQQIDELQLLMRENESLRAQYFQYLVTHAMLEWRHGISTSPTSFPVEQQHIGEMGRPVESSGAGAHSTASGGSSQPRKTIIPPISLFGGFGSQFTFYSVLALLALFGAGVAGYVIHTATRAKQNEQGGAVAIQHEGTRSRNDGIVARFTAGVNCNWESGATSPNLGDELKVGQSFKLASGIAEMTFGIGARVILQSPSTMTVDSAKSVRLESGKLTAEITTADARGFKVLTPDGAFVDQGTEFGIEVPPGGGSRIHVFKGEVDLALGNQPNTATPTHRLLANSGARLYGEASNVTFVQDTGETFVRSMDQTERDLHVLAYWRFEDHPVGTLLPDTKGNREVTVATVDSSFNGNDLYTFFQHTRPSFSEAVPSVTVPQTGRPNRTCLDNTEFPGPSSTRDVYTNSAFSHASPIDVQRVTPAEWTIEASVKVMELGRTETFVGRDGSAVYSSNKTPCLAFQVTADGHLAIQFKDAEDRTHVATANDFTVEADRWYHVAAVSDGKQLLLYVNSIDGRGYRLIAKTELPAAGSTALASGGPSSVWSLGRGRAQNGVPGQWFKGWIDEVRICDAALDPSVFLFFEKKATNDIGNDSNGSDALANSAGN